jgi:hypothetical protein
VRQSCGMVHTDNLLQSACQGRKSAFAQSLSADS